MTDDEALDSLLGALSKTRVPVENHGFIRQFTTAIGIVEYRAVERSDKPYVIATRSDGRPDLHIHYGFTNGFISEEEIVRVAGSGVGRAPSSRKGTWYIEHPVTRVHHGAERPRDVRRTAGFCRCGMQLSVTGVCGNCD
ncbi:hypothetical protein A5733_03270 [Mycobacterium sp. NS-7484]|uniref:hypothetical protein n=1 Tax=Mycobacterium sp. NS-7484 TaxID=1834161 RepID=UPI00096EA0F5|nr:hypothetical protein [Mycobacterium sp. NS-7484]OMC01065.1 hypothetical protein A5733_03270 [Mycobacterium sp. NS-7484]